MLRYMAVCAIALPALAACRQDPPPASAQAEPPPLAAAASDPAGSAAFAASQPLLDFRDHASMEVPEPDAAEQQRIVRLLGAEKSPEAAITSRFEGAFTRPDASQVVALLVPEGAAAIDTFPAPATLAVLEGDKVVARHTFGKDDSGWQWVRKPVDTDGDGVHELLLTSSWMQMGESGTALLVASLKDGRYRELQRFDNAAHDNCTASVDTPGKGKARAAVYSLEAGKVVETRYKAACVPNDGKQVWAKDPSPDAFKPAE